jgi:hypothetical protein
MLVRVDDLDDGVAVLRLAGLSVERRTDDLRVTISAAHAGQVTEALARSGHWVTDLRPEERSLEELFLELTCGQEPALVPTREEVPA